MLALKRWFYRLSRLIFKVRHSLPNDEAESRRGRDRKISNYLRERIKQDL